MAGARIAVPRIPRSLIILSHDVLAAQAALVLAVVLAHDGHLFRRDISFLSTAVPLFVVLTGVAFAAFGLHRQVWSYISDRELGAIVKAASVAVALFVVISVATKRAPDALLAVIVIQWLVLVVLLCASRLLYRIVKTRGRRPGARRTARDMPVLVCGCAPIASLFIRTVQSMPESNVRVVGIIDDAPQRCGRHLHQVPILGQLRDLDRVLAELAVQGISPRRLLVAGADPALLAQARKAAAECRSRHSLELHHLPDMMSLHPAVAAHEADAGAALPERPYFRARRALEVVLGAVLLLALAPLIGAIALAVLVDLGRPVLFRQVRPGRYMRPFTLQKFRTMRAAYADGTIVPDHQRTSALGRFLRRSRLDELPQLFNVLSGDMSFIGPRPLLPRDLPDDGGERLAVRPGITGWAQVNGGHKLVPADKAALDRWYVRHASLTIDARILWRTLRMMVLGEEINRFELEHAATPCRERRRLLVVGRYFHPDECATSQLLTDLVAALAPERFATTVLTGRENYVNTGIRLPRRQGFAGAEVRRVWHTHFGRAALTGRATDDITFGASAFLALITTARPGDVVLTGTDPPLISVLAWLAARLTGARQVNWCQDLFPEVAAAAGIGLARGQLGRGLRVLRNASLKGAETNVALCDGMAARLIAEGVPHDRVTVIPNWADGAAVRPLPPAANPLRQAWGLAERFVIGYSGNLGIVHEVESVVELMTALRHEPGLVFLFVGAGGGYRRLRAAAAERRLENTAFQPYQPRHLLPQSLTVPDLHLVTLRPVFEGLVMPSKLYGALAAGRPIVFIGDPDGDTGRIVGSGLGLVAAPGQTAPLAAGIKALRRDPARLARMGEAARRAYDATWNKDASLAAWTACLDAAAQPAAAPSPRRSRRNDHGRRHSQAPHAGGTRSRRVRAPGDRRQPQLRLAHRLAHLQRAAVSECPGPARRAGRQRCCAASARGSAAASSSSRG